ncbi:tRNase Z TRZ1 (Nuclear ribonuclease Z) (Nuclear RNase Z) (Short tRNase Z 1) (Zinc phosphodiesterase NUZ) (tRNA 3 endonuclease) (tRNase ZS1) (AthTRZS1) [Durusdinium trenchii]|uniref:TRNase Z TRZ1 (Nuclear ribonuclease Z) (Nuclear RNase Z) (Short tRNase Z 1) (Zinc phosphodiesterase NUZ) (tRNA 3 endonuclease) (tRNase ZS1) (AthTRZS1) n=1 Tax=Durusdinium trenchii TaxID=1381693 RepID=A0ABP0IT67_9DINO
MIENLPVKSLTHEGLTLEGYSRAAVQTYWRVPELKLGFDLGGSPWSFMGTPTYFISHAHLDHMAALPAYVARRRMMKMDPPAIYIPAEVVESVERMLKSWQRLDRGRMLCELIGVSPGDEISLSREHVVTVFATDHTVPSVGYIVWERRKKLKPEYQGLSGDEIRDVALSGVEVSAEIRVPIVAYCGDTAPKALDACPDVYKARILITETTFFRPEHRREKIHKYGHTHLDDIVARADRFENELIVLGHFSTRYHDKQIRRACEKRMPAELMSRTELWMSGTQQRERMMMSRFYSVGWLMVLPLLATFVAAQEERAGAGSAAPQQVAVLKGFSDWVTSVEFAPDDSVLAAGSYEEVRLWDVVAREEMGRLKLKSGFARSLAFSPNGSTLAVGSYQAIELWDLKTRQRVGILKGHRGYVTDVLFLADGELLSASEDRSVRQWSLSDSQETGRLEGITQPVMDLAYSPETGTVAAALGDDTRLTQAGRVQVWQLPGTTPLHTFDDHESGALSVAFANAGTQLLSGSLDEKVHSYSLPEGSLTQTYDEHSRPVNDLVRIAGTSLAVSGSGGRFKGKNLVRIWNVSSNEDLAAFEPHKEKINAIAVSGNGETLATAGNDRMVTVWDISSLLSAGRTEEPSGNTATRQSEASRVAELAYETLHRTAFLADDAKAVKRVGIIGLDTSHSIAFTKMLNAEEPEPEFAGFQVVAAYPYGSRTIESSTSRIPQYSETVEGLGVKVVDSIDALLAEVDVVLLETNDGRPHLEQALKVFEAGKPVFIDKPVAGSLADCLAIYQAAEKFGVPVFSSSSLRFMPSALAARKGSLGDVVGCDTFSPCSLEATHPDLFWYGIHGVEILFTVMGPDVQQVTRVSTESTDVAAGVWEGGRIGTFRGLRDGKRGYGGTVFGSKGIGQLNDYGGYRPLLVEIVEFFKSGEPPVLADETIALYAFMEAADESKRQGGKPVQIADVMAKAQKEAESRLEALLAK